MPSSLIRLLGSLRLVARGDFLETENGLAMSPARTSSISEVLVRVHLHQAADALARVLMRGCESHRPGGEDARIDAEESEISTMGSVAILNASAANGTSSDGAARGGIAVRVDTLHRRTIRRRRQVVDDGVEQRLHPFVLERRAAEHRHNFAFQTPAGECRGLRSSTLEIAGDHVLAGDLVVAVGRGRDELVTILGGAALRSAAGIFALLEAHALGFCRPR